MLEDAYAQAPELLASVFSSAFMWAANAGTVIPSADSIDGKMHVTPANLVANFHRSLEPHDMTHNLRHIFHDKAHFTVHDALPATPRFADEGAANHMRICAEHGAQGRHIFVYGLDAHNPIPTKRYPARQHLEGCQRLLAPVKAESMYMRQHPDAIDAGVFHHDVIGMNTTNLMISHETAFADKPAFLSGLKKLSDNISLNYIEISDEELPIEDAVRSYFFNSQLLALPDGGFAIVAPGECEEIANARAALTQLKEGNSPVSQVHYLDVRESMRNGGGPACLRLRVVLTDEEAAAMKQEIILSPEREEALRAWVQAHYRDRLVLDDLRDPAFVNELESAYHELYSMIGIPIAA